jgi:UDP-N-acetylglucosamine/UDP-N-acetylgalactosamine diphosphorylase
MSPNTPQPSTDLADVRARLAASGQSHLLHFYDQLPASKRAALLAQIASLDLESLPELIEGYVRRAPKFELPRDLKPARFYAHDTSRTPWDREKFRHIGEALIRAGKVAAFVVAGGQGSRLGYDGPKGCFQGGAVSGKSLFQIFADNLLGAMDRYSVRVPWYIMTSPLNHDATVDFFQKHGFFGLSSRDVMFFPQGVMPSLDMASGRVLLSSPGEVATNPDGHGGAIRALHVSGALANMKSRGIEHVSYFQVDNPCVRVLDPVFLGLHAAATDSSAEMSSKMVPKTSPEEKVGVFCEGDGKTQVIEYSDLPMDLQRERLPDGALRFIAGSIAIHALSVDFIERLATDKSFALPYHRAEKKIPHVDLETGRAVTPDANNGVKLERFVFDALPMCKASIVLETDRVEEFAPIKNASGADSPASSRDLQTLRASRWLASCGVRVPTRSDGQPDCVIEISPRTATCAEELARALPQGFSIAPGAKIAL